MSSIKIAVITGGHPFDVQPFHELFASFPGVESYIQHTDEFASEPDEVRDRYDAVVVYSMYPQTPQDGVLWYAGKPKSAYERLWERGQGIVLLHHGLLAYREWPDWDDLCGMKGRFMRSFHQNEKVLVEVSDARHPISQGRSGWEMLDETYLFENAVVMPEDLPGNQIFLTTKNAHSMKTLGWTRQYRKSRVFCFVSGHGVLTYANPDFRAVLLKGIHWTVGQ